MPSPFPGMDPYLEDPRRWRDVHHRLITYAADELSSILPPGYVADIDERLYVAQSGRDVYPDVTVARRPVPHATTLGATTALADPPQIVRSLVEEAREGFILVTAVDSNRVVATIEVLSPTNKTPGGEGRRIYLEKQAEMLAGSASLLEIDLLRFGKRTTAISPAAFVRSPAARYIACLHRAGAGAHLFECWPVALRERLPRVAVPLDADPPDVVLDLQQLVDRVYDAGAYARKLDYTADPVPPLDAEEATWADALLREMGLRA